MECWDTSCIGHVYLDTCLVGFNTRGGVELKDLDRKLIKNGLFIGLNLITVCPTCYAILCLDSLKVHYNKFLLNIHTRKNNISALVCTVKSNMTKKY